MDGGQETGEEEKAQGGAGLAKKMTKQESKKYIEYFKPVKGSSWQTEQLSTSGLMKIGKGRPCSGLFNNFLNSDGQWLLSFYKIIT